MRPPLIQRMPWVSATGFVMTVYGVFLSQANLFSMNTNIVSSAINFTFSINKEPQFHDGQFLNTIISGVGIVLILLGFFKAGPRKDKGL